MATLCRLYLSIYSSSPVSALPSHGGNPSAAHEGTAGLLCPLGGRYSCADWAGEWAWDGNEDGDAEKRVLAWPGPVTHSTHLAQVHEEFKQNIENISVEMLLRKFAESKGTGREKPGE